MVELEIQSKMPELARKKVMPEDRGADFALEFLGEWSRIDGPDEERSRQTRELIVKRRWLPEGGARDEREAGFQLAERLLANARTELTK